MVFFGKSRSLAAEHAQESPPLMTAPLIALAVFAGLGGILNHPSLHTLSTWLEHTLKGNLVEAEFVIAIAIFSTIFGLISIATGWWIYNPAKYEAFWAEPAAKRPDDPLRRMIGPVFEMLKNKYWVDELYWAVILNPYISLARFLADVVDWRFWHDWFHDKVLVAGYNRLTGLLALRVDLDVIDWIPNELGDLTKGAASAIRKIQTGYVRNYALSIFLGLVIILGYLLLR
jgi:NADH-quinone oxidoreductase subunit L